MRCRDGRPERSQTGSGPAAAAEPRTAFVSSQRTYTRDSDGMDVTLQICNWPEIVQATHAGASAASNPMMAQVFKQQGIDLAGLTGVFK